LQSLWFNPIMARIYYLPVFKQACKPLHHWCNWSKINDCHHFRGKTLPDPVRKCKNVFFQDTTNNYGTQGGGTPGMRPPPPKIGKNMIFWADQVCFQIVQ
jgi:hypothetical protein